ncbi:MULTISPECIES: hypothetical protein [unclassified Streptomyces]|uniref:hypothetical protein n=1 Tax=unclassified Streptomyces TaxID=2593676 RepID=UPI002E37BCE9|nr:MULTISPECIES: hypothetical protein [unclassified Streptomyces]WUC68333.1 hypothetical protein OG861_31075 [Streptomyces sp. NBC_00539]
MALDDPHPTSGNAPGPLDRAGSKARPDTDADPAFGSERLPCGRPLARAWEQARDPAAAAADPHTTGCTFCREAVEALTALDRATRALRAEERPDVRTLGDRIINAVRAETRLGPMLLLDDPDRNLRIAERTAAKVLRRAADSIPGARAASCRFTPLQEGDTLHTVSMTIAAALDDPLPELAEEVRQAVLGAADHLLGLAVATVDLTINAVLESPTRPVEGNP